MSARAIVEETMPGLDPERQEAIGNSIMAFLQHKPPLPSGTIYVNTPAEAAYVAHVAHGTCTAEYFPAAYGNSGVREIGVQLKRVRNNHADASEWATKPDDPGATPRPLAHHRLGR